MSLTVTLTFALVVALEIIIPLALGYLIIRRYGLRWSIFLYGALFFILSQVIHIPLLYLAEPSYSEWIRSAIADPALALAALALFLGLFAGVLEECVRYLVFSRFFPRKKINLTREHGLLFGAGWGGIESIFVALLVLQSMILYIVLTSGGPEALLINATIGDPSQMAALESIKALTPTDILPGLFERIMTITLHIAFTMLVLLAVARARLLYLLAAIAWHTVMDFFAVYIALMYGIWPSEAILAVNAVLGIAVIWGIWKAMERRELVSSL
ncbi:MAG TPA: YhfC family glutamic-type intramembrane protease [Methanoregulaceae archaeon]|nr:YhfC family glutamic-type intramembrane protease [Methanoregulaceae archaeon]